MGFNSTFKGLIYPFTCASLIDSVSTSLYTPSNGKVVN